MKNPEEDLPVRGLSALRDVTPPPSLVPGTMQRLRDVPAPSFWAWMWRPRRVELRISPLGAGALALATAASAFLMIARTPAPSFSSDHAAQAIVIPATPPTSEPVRVRFVLSAQGARRVAIAGDFNGWNPDGTLMEESAADGTFVATLALPPGTHEYMFVVDGRWITDPSADERRPDGFGRENAILRL